MKKNNLIICDSDEKYCKKLDGFLRECLSIPFTISEYTNAGYLREFEGKQDALLVISEKLFSFDVVEGFKNILVLLEMPKAVCERENVFGLDDANIKYTAKYQSGEKISESILSMCLDMPGVIVANPRLKAKSSLKLIGFYTPVKSILQTKIALDFAKQLAGGERCLYVNNDPYCCERELKADEFSENITDLMYYSECERDKFSLYLEKIAKRLGKLYYLPTSDGQIRDANAASYLRLISCIEESGKYETMVLDLTEEMPSFTEVLKRLDTLIVLTSQGKYAEDKLRIFMNELENTEGFPTEIVMKVDASRVQDLPGMIIKEMKKGDRFEKRGIKESN